MFLFIIFEFAAKLCILLVKPWIFRCLWPFFLNEFLKQSNHVSCSSLISIQFVPIPSLPFPIRYQDAEKCIKYSSHSLNRPDRQWLILSWLITWCFGIGCQKLHWPWVIFPTEISHLELEDKCQCYQKIFKT